MATISRQVQFKGIDSVLESQKTEKGNRERKARRERKKAKKTEVRDAKEDLRYFVLFLQTYQLQNPHRPSSLRQVMQSIDGIIILRLLFRGAADDAECFQKFEEFVTNKELPREDKSLLKAHIRQLTTLMEICEQHGIYTDLDRFLHEFRHSDQLGTLDDYFVGFSPDDAAIFRRLLEDFRRHGIGLTRANDLSPADREGLRALMDAHNAAARPNQNTLPVSSSDESSDDDEELETI